MVDCNASSWILVEEASLTYCNGGRIMRAFNVCFDDDFDQRGILKGQNVKTKEPIEVEIHNVRAQIIYYDEDKKESDFHMVFSSLDAEYVIVAPNTIYSPFYMEIQGLLVLIYSIVEKKIDESELKTLFLRLSEFLILNYDNEPRLMQFIKESTGYSYYDYQRLLHNYFRDLSIRKTKYPDYMNVNFRSAIQIQDAGSGTMTSTRYPLTDIESPYKMFLPVDINNPCDGIHSSEIIVSHLNVEQKREIILDLLDQFSWTEEDKQFPPLLSLDKKPTSRKKSKVSIVVNKN
eukprot:NODE_2_length_91304_cov_0.692462.p34 type:complete len:290 gc:universal NODE_2_length_91304_cov_0.692462:18196-17327(-)